MANREEFYRIGIDKASAIVVTESPIGTYNDSPAPSKGVEGEGKTSEVEPVGLVKGKSETKTGSSPEKNLPSK